MKPLHVELWIIWRSGSKDIFDKTFERLTLLLLLRQLLLIRLRLLLPLPLMALQPLLLLLPEGIPESVRRTISLEDRKCVVADHGRTKLGYRSDAGLARAGMIWSSV